MRHLVAASLALLVACSNDVDSKPVDRPASSRLVVGTITPLAVVGPTGVYFVEGTSIFHCPLTGCGPIPELVAPRQPLGQMKLGPKYLHWVEDDPPSIASCPLDGPCDPVGDGLPTMKSTGQVVNPVVDGDELVFIDDTTACADSPYPYPRKAIVSCSLPGCANRHEVWSQSCADLQNASYGLALGMVQDRHIVFANLGGATSQSGSNIFPVLSCSLDDCSHPATMMMPFSVFGNGAIDQAIGAGSYFVRTFTFDPKHPSATIYSCPLTGCDQPTAIFSQPTYTNFSSSGSLSGAMKIVGDRLLFADYSSYNIYNSYDVTLLECPVTGCTAAPEVFPRDRSMTLSPSQYGNGMQRGFFIGAVGNDVYIDGTFHGTWLLQGLYQTQL